MFDNGIISIFIEFNQKVHNLMVEEASLWPNLETGGMLFGKIKEGENSLNITIDRMYIPPDSNCIRKSSYYEIDPIYAKKILENEPTLYLGNWHKHLGYGGPSSGDQRQIEEFFLNNPHLNVIITCILDFLSEDNHELIIEVYKKFNDGSITKEVSFQTFRVRAENITYFDNEIPQVKLRTGISQDRINMIKHSLHEVFEFRFPINNIDDFPGSTKGEVIISFPFKTSIDISGEKPEINLLILLSIPPEFPKGQIFIDLSSKDMSKTITINKHDADVLNNEELILPFLELLRVNLEDDILSLLKQPLWKVLNS